MNTTSVVACLSTEHRTGLVLTFQREDVERFTILAYMRDTKCREKFCVLVAGNESDGALEWMRCIGFRKIIDMTVRHDSFLVNATDSDAGDDDGAWAVIGYEQFMGAKYGFNQGSPSKRKFSEGNVHGNTLPSKC
jgi:hypothetical protein